MAAARSNGTSDKLKVAGRCLDCIVPGEVDELSGRMNRVQGNDLPEMNARIERVARNGDVQASRLNAAVDKLERLPAKFEKRFDDLQDKLGIIAAAFEKTLGDFATLGATVGRVGTRKLKTPEAKP